MNKLPNLKTMNALPNATVSQSGSLFTFSKVCRLTLALVCLTMAASVCQAQYFYLDNNTTIDNPDEFAEDHLSPYKDLVLNGFTLTLDISESRSITKYFFVKGDQSKTTNNVVKTGNGVLTVPQTGNLNARFTSTVNALIIEQGELVLERDCIYVDSSVEIQQNGTLTIKNNMSGGSYLRNLTGAGKLNANTTDSVGVILQNTADSKFDGIITGTGNLRLRGNGNNNYTLTLTGANTNTGLISFDKSSTSATGGVLNLTLQDNAIVASCPINGQNCPVTLTYDVTNGERKITITGDTYVKNLKTIAKSGDGTLKIYSEAGDAVQAQGWVISSGRVDCAGYFGAFQDYGIVVESGATFSAGDTIGKYMTKQSDIIIKESGIALFEFAQFREGTFDTITIGGGNKYSFTLEDGSFVELKFLGNDAESWAVEGAEYQLVKDPNFAVDKDYSSLLRGTGSNLFLLEGRKNQGLFLVYNPEPTPVVESVPEPSTWALLTLGVAGLIYWRKRKN